MSTATVGVVELKQTPIGKHAAMQDWAVVAKVQDPFSKGWISGTFSLRPDWSPDGSLLAAVNSFQSPCHTVALLERGSWSFDFSMVGHRGAPRAAQLWHAQRYADLGVEDGKGLSHVR